MQTGKECRVPTTIFYVVLAVETIHEKTDVTVEVVLFFFFFFLYSSSGPVQESSEQPLPSH